MNNVLYLISLNLLMLIILVLLLLNINKENKIKAFSAYYNSAGGFVGFIQKKNNSYKD